MAVMALFPLGVIPSFVFSMIISPSQYLPLVFKVLLLSVVIEAMVLPVYLIVADSIRLPPHISAVLQESNILRRL